MKRLYRSRREKVIAGVAGGMAEYFQVDPTLVRLVWIIAAFSGVGVLAYIVAAIVVPEAPYGATPPYWTPAEAPVSSGPASPAPTVEPGEQPEASGRPGMEPIAEPGAGPGARPIEPPPGHRIESPRGVASDPSRTFGIVLVAVGALLLVRRVLPHFVLDNMWPAILIIIGAYFVAQATRGRRS